MNRMVRLIFLDDECLEMGARSYFDLVLLVSRSLGVLFDVEGTGAKGIKRNRHLCVLCQRNKKEQTMAKNFSGYGPIGVKKNLGGGGGEVWLTPTTPSSVHLDGDESNSILFVFFLFLRKYFCSDTLLDHNLI
jgi:hypothetical protein